jgi:23S rRNA (guanosine2251-2'-O)-methyltransferase
MEWDTKKNNGPCKSRRVYGVHSVQEYLRLLPHTIEEVYLLASLKGNPIDQLARRETIPVRYESRSFFDSFSEGGVHQGVAARLRPFAYMPLQALLRRDSNFLLVLDGVLDPRNLGALLRTAEAVGVGGVILPQRRSASLSPLVEKVAAGATASVPICQVSNLARSLDVIRESGYWIVGLSPDATQSLYDLRLSSKIALLLGSEGEGLRYLTRQKCDTLIAIPMRGKIKSLNVAVAGAVTLYELLRRTLSRDEKKNH